MRYLCNVNIFMFSIRRSMPGHKTTDKVFRVIIIRRSFYKYVY